MRPQRRSARGTVGHPYSALNLRFALALFGLVSSAALAVVAAWAGLGWLVAVLVLLAVVAAVDLVVIRRRRAARRRADPGADHSLFE